MTEAHSRSSRILRNTLSNSAGRIVTLATTFVMTPFILRQLGETAFGIWILATVVVGYGVLLDFGMGSAVVRSTAAARARKDPCAAHALMGTATRIYVGLAVVALALGGTLASQSALVLQDSQMSATARAVLMLVTVSFAINLATTPANAALRGLQRYDVTNLIMVANALTMAGLTVLVLQRGGGVVAMAALTVPVTLLSQLTTVLVLRRLNADFAPRWSPASRPVARSLTAFGATLSVTDLAELLHKRTSEIIIATFMSVATVAPFFLARRLSDVPHVISDQFIKVLLPVASELHATGEVHGLNRLFLVSTRVTLALMLPLALCASFLAGDLLELWVGPRYRGEAVLVILLVIASVVITSQWPAGSIFQGTGRFGWFAVASLTSGVANVLLTLILIQPYGLIGVVVGTLVPNVLEALMFVLPYTLWRLRIRLVEYLREAIAPALLPAIPSAAVLVVSGEIVSQPSWFSLGVTGAAAVLAYAAAYLAVPSAAAERSVAARAVRRVVQRSR